MPAGSRVRANNVYGTTQDNPLLVGAVSFTSLGLNLLPAISGQHAVIVLDPKRLFGEPEIVVVTSHLAMGTTATITRGTYGTTAREHPQGTPWAHVPVGPDDYTPIVTSVTRPADPYRGEMIFETDTNSFVARTTSDTWQTVVPLGVWTPFTPTLTQGGAVTKTVNLGKYIRVGRLITAQVFMTCTGAGTASTIILAGLPVAGGAPGNTPYGSARILDQSTSAFYKAFAVTQVDAVQIAFAPTNTTTFDLLGTQVFTAALAAGDEIVYTVTYEAAA